MDICNSQCLALSGAAPPQADGIDTNAPQALRNWRS